MCLVTDNLYNTHHLTVKCIEQSTLTYNSKRLNRCNHACELVTDTHVETESVFILLIAHNMPSPVPRCRANRKVRVLSQFWKEFVTSTSAPK